MSLVICNKHDNCIAAKRPHFPCSHAKAHEDSGCDQFTGCSYFHDSICVDADSLVKDWD